MSPIPLLTHPVYGRYVIFAVRALVVLAVIAVILLLIIWPIPIVSSLVVNPKPTIPTLLIMGLSVLYLHYKLPFILAQRFERSEV